MEKTFVSRGGNKLEKALSEFQIDVTGTTVLDIGSSTGGFVDCLLQNGAAKVYAVDTAYGELAWKLRKDKRVEVIERQNILFLPPLSEQVDLVTIDVTFTPLTKILPIARENLKDGGLIIALLKPQYEDSPRAVKNGGVLEPSVALEIKDRVIADLSKEGYVVKKCIDSPILGGSGNREFLLSIEK